MRETNWPGVATAVAILWIFSTVVWLGVAGPIWYASKNANSDAWIGFAGNALGAGVAMLAAIVAGIAAYRTIVPMQRQLSELIRQNSFAHYERLRQRAADLMDMKVLIEKVTANLTVMNLSLSMSGLGANEGRATAFERLETSVTALNVSRRLVWGDENAQSLTVYFADNSLRAANVARNATLGTRTPFVKEDWIAAMDTAFQGGVALHARIQMETEMLSKEIAALEPLILNRQPLTQLWSGNYPGPETMAAMSSTNTNPRRDPGHKVG